MLKNRAFSELVEKGQPTGEVVGVNRFLAKVSGLAKVQFGATVLFEDGTSGFVYAVRDDHVLVLNLNSERIDNGSLVVLRTNELSIGVSQKMIGRIVSPLGFPVDGKEFIPVDKVLPVFADPLDFKEREILNTQLETGVTLVDISFPIILGQRIAVMGDSKTGKTSFLVQLTINQVKKDRVVVYVMIGKRKSDTEALLSKLKKQHALDKVVIVLADVDDALPMTYLAPYSGCTIAEFFWKAGNDVVIIYDDLSNHAKAYRELSLMLRQNPGREAYPGDMFHAHAMLLERAGKLSTNHKSLTALPVSLSPNNDMTGYLSTNLISITDGQIMFDSEIFRRDTKPAINLGLSVSRVGGRGQTDAIRKIAHDVSKKMADYRRAREITQFISEQSNESRSVIEMGEKISEVFQQRPDELFSLLEQQIMLQTVLASAGQSEYDVKRLKKMVKDLPSHEKTINNVDQIVAKLLKPVEEVVK